MDQTLLEVSNLVKYFPAPYGLFDRLLKKERRTVRAVDDVSFHISNNETLGLVGESGSGKTSLANAIMMLDVPSSGSIRLSGNELSKMRGNSLREVRRKIQIVFQNPYTSLDPRQRVRDILLEPLTAFGNKSKSENEQLISKTLESVGLPKNCGSRFPHEFSGGQKQRIAIARALVLNPDLIVLDEPTSALDTSIQAQILNLLRQIQKDRKVSYLFITHNVNVVKFMADRIAVMYAGKIVEIGKTKDVLERPLHPYTRSLIESVPTLRRELASGRSSAKTELSTNLNPVVGCRFSNRCRYAKSVCTTDEPHLRTIETTHAAACHFSEEIAQDGEISSDLKETRAAA
jgi:oligopeptide/dipeptide ABC transporter ATP-binding protein